MQKYYFYPRSPCGERPSKLAQTSLIEYISIHALLAESDVTVLGIQHKVGISIHALLAESDHLCVCVIELIQNFYPRSPCGERQSSRCGWKQVIYYFYPRSPCGERRVTVLGIQHRVGISIHALLAESDWFSYVQFVFLSTLSLRRATPSTTATTCVAIANFYPRSPCGERRKLRKGKITMSIFLSTLSLRRATLRMGCRVSFSMISIHALLAESDQSRVRVCQAVIQFLSTLSLRRATSS